MSGEASEYDSTFFAEIEDGARRSAQIVIPHVLELFSPQSIVDVGGGAGHWAAACLGKGVRDVLTVDGPWVPKATRVMPPERFLEQDLTRPVLLRRTFDLALCLETAEHLPALVAPELVRTLTTAAPVVVFSAALPGQGGHSHVNEQLASYWARLFAHQDYACFADLRRRTWNNQEIEVWYRQNIMCYVRRSELHRWRELLVDPIEDEHPLLDVAHPELLLRHKSRGDRLEAYAHRLETEAERLRTDADRLREITDSRTWRLLQLATAPIRFLRRR